MVPELPPHSKFREGKLLDLWKPELIAERQRPLSSKRVKPPRNPDSSGRPTSSQDPRKGRLQVRVGDVGVKGKFNMKPLLPSAIRRSNKKVNNSHSEIDRNINTSSPATTAVNQIENNDSCLSLMLSHRSISCLPEEGPACIASLPPYQDTIPRSCNWTIADNTKASIANALVMVSRGNYYYPRNFMKREGRKRGIPVAESNGPVWK